MTGALRRRPPPALMVLALYTALSLLFFGGPVLRAPTRVGIGASNDPSLLMWMFEWWPHAIAHGLDPLYTRLLFAPDGFNLMWTVSMPGPGLVVAPITLTAGPLVAYDVLALLAPALSAFTAFLLCRHVTGRLWPSIVGGYVFGFSDFMLGTLVRGHLHLALLVLLPVCVLLVLHHLEGSLPAQRFVVLLAAALAGQFLISTEMLLLLTLFGGLAVVLGLVFWEQRGRLARTAGLIALSYTAMAVVLSPLFYYALFKAGTTPQNSPSVYASDLANFVIPTSLTRFGHSYFLPIAKAFHGNPSEQGAYLGIPLLVIVGLFAAERRKSVGDWVLVVGFVVGAAMSLGPRLHVSGVTAAKMPMPWDLMTHVPLARYALPPRMLAFTFLAAALMVALWLARRPSIGGWLLAALGIAAILPNSGLPEYHQTYTTPKFISQGAYKGRLNARDRVLVIPFAGSSAMRWQAQTHMRFALVGGYVQRLPDSYTRWPIVASLLANRAGPDADRELRRFLVTKRVTAILVLKRHAGPWPAVLARMQLTATDTGGMLLYRLRRP